MKVETYHDPGSRSRCVRLMRRDYRYPNGVVIGYFRSFAHHPEDDLPIPGRDAGAQLQNVVEQLLHEAGIRDGDEYEIAVTPTGRRPHGDRYYIQDGNGGAFRPETDDECLERIERSHGNKAGSGTV